MIRQVFLFFILLFLTGSSDFVYGQNFAQRCEGTWQGTMYIYSRGALVDSVPVIFTVVPFGGEAGYWIWKTEYISEKTPVTKNYTLVQKPDQTNVFLLDEGDGVVLTNYVYNQKMYSLFEVDGIWLTASYEFVNDQLIFEVTSGSVSDEKTKDVTNYTFDTVQRVLFTKIP